jgi:hypothetical protein
MDIRASGWVLVLIASAAAAADEPREPSVDVLLCDASTMPAALVSRIAAEAAAVWSEAGVALRTVVAADCASPPSFAAPFVVVRIDRSALPPSPGGRRPVASIVFRDRHPVPVIRLSLQSARWLMANDPATRATLAAAPRVAEQWVGRMLGRALAHEIGHYLLRTPEHTPSGLMRASYTVQAFVAPDRSPFHLSPAQRRRLLAEYAMPALADLASAKN